MGAPLRVHKESENAAPSTSTIPYQGSEPFIAFKLENVDRNLPSFEHANSDILPRPNHYGPHTSAEKIYFMVPRAVLKRWNGVYN